MKFTFTSGQKPLAGFTVKCGVGRGGFGEVYFAESDGGKEVALKLIRVNTDIELRGIRQCLNLKHPNLVHLYDLRSDPQGDHWLVMEYVRGETLSTLLKRYPQGVGPDLAGQWFVGLAAGIQHLHDQGIVHRDLKPGNVFLENGTIKIVDYGLCKVLDDSQIGKQTQSVGTVHYMAPEVPSGKYRHHVDIYSAGIILYELLTSRVPFDGDNSVEILLKHQSARPDLSKVPAAFVPIMDRALRKDPTQRFQSIQEMSKAVAGVLALQGKPVDLGESRNHLASTLHLGPQGDSGQISNNRQRLADLSGTLLLATFLAGLFTFVLGALLKSGDWQAMAPVFFLTSLSSAAVLVPVKLWNRPADESWPRRLLFTGLGLVIGVAGLWFDGYQLPLPWSGGAGADSLQPLVVPGDPPRHPFFGFLYADNRSLPVLGGYLGYFGLMFLTLRWWKIGEERRPQRFSVQPVLATAFWAYLLLFLLPAAPQRLEGFASLVLASVIVQLVSPWEEHNVERNKRQRLQYA